MKTIHTALVIIMISATTYGQGLIGDIMNVETVNIELTEENEKLKAEYDETLEKETADLEDDLTKLDEDYTEDVTKLIEDFTKDLADGDEKLVTNEKKRVVTRVKSLTMTHKKQKKNVIQSFLNQMQIANRKLPDFMRKEADMGVKETASTHMKTFDEQYVANINAIKSFEMKEHLVINESSSASTN